MSKALSKLNALCDVLSFMRTPTAFDSANQMYKHFCKPKAGTIHVRYFTNRRGKIWAVQFEYTTWLGAISKVEIETTKYYFILSNSRSFLLPPYLSISYVKVQEKDSLTS